MKYISSIAVPLIIIIWFSSCKKDSIITDNSPFMPTGESVSGSAFFDISGDGIGEEPMTNSIVLMGDSLLLSDNDSIGFDPDALETIVDNDGNYIFESVVPKENQVIRIFPNHQYSNLTGIDHTPDGDINETMENELIQISIDPDEADDGNDFVAFKIQIVPTAQSISGYTLEDINMDLIGDLPLSDQRLELYERASNGVPSGDLIAWDYSDENGYYEFNNIPNGAYVIYFIGSPSTPSFCVNSMDQSQEPGEPFNNGLCIFIPVNLSEIVTFDQDNIYVHSNTETDGPASLAGKILEDITSDGQPDLAADLIVTVDIYERDSNGFISGPILYSTESNSDGSFTFDDDLAIGNYGVILRENSGVFESYYGFSNSSGPQPLPNVIPVTITEGNEMIGANFWIFTYDNIPSISGQIREDTNGDGVGDTPNYDHTIKLYLRGNDNLPTGSIIYTTGSNSGGNLYFTNLNTGEYVLELSGPNDYECTSSGDESPENGEPTSTNGCRYIPVDFVEGVEDLDNNYTVFQN